MKGLGSLGERVRVLKKGEVGWYENGRR